MAHECVGRRETSAIYDVFTTCRFITPILLKSPCLSRNIFMRSFKIFFFSFRFHCGAFITQSLSVPTLAAPRMTLKPGEGMPSCIMKIILIILLRGLYFTKRINSKVNKCFCAVKNYLIIIQVDILLRWIYFHLYFRLLCTNMNFTVLL